MQVAEFMAKLEEYYGAVSNAPLQRDIKVMAILERLQGEKGAVLSAAYEHLIESYGKLRFPTLPDILEAVAKGKAKLGGGIPQGISDPTSIRDEWNRRANEARAEASRYHRDFLNSNIFLEATRGCTPEMHELISEFVKECAMLQSCRIKQLRNYGCNYHKCAEWVFYECRQQSHPVHFGNIHVALPGWLYRMRSPQDLKRPWEKGEMEQSMREPLPTAYID